LFFFCSIDPRQNVHQSLRVGHRKIARRPSTKADIQAGLRGGPARLSKYCAVPATAFEEPETGGYKASDDRDRFGAQGYGMSKQAMREEAERLIRETMARKAIVVKQGDTRIEAVCGKCGAANRVSAPKGQTRVAFTCKECGHKQETL
jgi:hypothetical protein